MISGRLINMIRSVVLLIIAGLFAPVLTAKEATPPSEFHRLLIFNEKEELMLVKIKDTDFWVTPGLYNPPKDTTMKELHQLASEYGLDIPSPELRGIFLLKSDQGDSNRYFYNVNVAEKESKQPDNISQVKWLSLEEATTTINIPHIVILLKQVMAKPEQVWGATLVRYQDGKKRKAKLIKDFHPIEGSHN